ncbi:hypothetical protein [Paenibacillus sp. FSL H8-0259]|uniref:hypothetical protein n=1 Tax=Paenibacillus sp. FSL H8-0259 TaxID=1920423 RepID=UPI00096C829E|nr:hypothetical protein [Paenibacillus sp. FSL H8-0259]OMF30940.1 hypothetical protein BK132_05790 [Paenibacillus sp. FSL H8-0259]
MPRKSKSFNAYQIDMHYLDTRGRQDVDAVKWDATVTTQLFASIYALNDADRTIRFKDSWLMYLDHLDEDQHYIFGRFSSAEYGTVGELLHADNLTRRPNPKLVREGENQSTYFIIKKADGLLLLQSNIRLNRPRFEEYIERLGAGVIAANTLTYIQVCTLLENNFFDGIRELNTIHKVEIEVSRSEVVADENEAVRALQNDVEEIHATDVKLQFEAKYQREGLHGVFPLVQKYKDQRGVTKIVVRGKLAGAEKVIRLDESQEKYRRKVEVDNNNQPLLTSTEDTLREIATNRRRLRG